MTAFEVLKLLRKLVAVQFIWLILLTCSFCFQFFKTAQKAQDALNQEICNLEVIPTEDLTNE